MTNKFVYLSLIIRSLMHGRPSESNVYSRPKYRSQTIREKEAFLKHINPKSLSGLWMIISPQLIFPTNSLRKKSICRPRTSLSSANRSENRYMSGRVVKETIRTRESVISISKTALIQLKTPQSTVIFSRITEFECTRTCFKSHWRSWISTS